LAGVIHKGFQMVRRWLALGLCLVAMGAGAAPAGGKSYAYQFVTLKAPAGTRLKPTRRTSAREARYLADFMIETRVGARPARIHVSCVRKGSRMMGKLTPMRFRDSIRRSVLTGEKVRERKTVRLAGTGMTGEAVRYGAGKTWELFAANPTTSVYVIWRANVPAAPVIDMLSTLRVR
jgi:hypothetical protein